MILLLLSPSGAPPTPPDPPTGVGAELETYDVAVAFTLPVGPGVTATLRRNGTIVAAGVTGSSYTFTGVADGDTLSVRSVSAGGESADVDTVFDFGTEIAAAVWTYTPRSLTG